MKRSGNATPKLIGFGIMTVFILIALAGCGGGSGSQSQNKGKISGKVTNNSGAPLFNANVSINGSNKNVTTDRLGNFTLTDIPTGTQKLNIVKNGYQSSQTDVTISENGSETNVELNPNENTATVSGVIKFE